MKKHKLFWLALCWLIPSICLAVRYTGDANYNEKIVVLIATNNLEQMVSARPKEAPGALAHILRPGSSHTWIMKRRSHITLIGEVYEETGWSSQRVLAEFDRNGWLADTIKISIDMHSKRNQTLQRGYITNYMPWAAKFEEKRNVHIGVLQAGQTSQPLDFPPGIIFLTGTFVEGPYKGQEFTDYLEIDKDPINGEWFNGQKWVEIGWHFPVDERSKNNSWPSYRR